MNDNQKEWLIRFIDQKLGTEELITFQKMLEDDKDFAQTVELAVFIHAQNRIKQKKHLLKLRNSLPAEQGKDVEQKPDKEHIAKKAESKKIAPFRFWIRAAAALFIVGLLSVLLYKMLDKKSPQQLASQYLTLREPLSSSRGNPNSSIWQKATNQYRNGDYGATIALLDSLEAEGADNPMSLFYAGLSRLYLTPPDYAEAGDKFRQILELEGGYQEQARWYLALVYVQTKAYQKALPLLDRMVVERGPMQKEARKMLESLKPALAD